MRLVRLASVFLVLFLVSGIVPVHAQSKVTLMVWELDPVREAVALFEEQNPDIEVELIHVPYDGYFDALFTRQLAGLGPDVFWVEPPDYLSYIDRDWLFDITGLLEQDPVLGEPGYFLPLEAPRSMVNGRWYGIGGGWMFNELFYDQATMDAAGIVPPPLKASEAWTWEEFIDTAQKLTRIEGDTYVRRGASLPTHYLNHIWSLVRSNAGDLYDIEKGVWTLDKPETIEALEAIADGFQRGLLISGWVGSIQDGSIAMALEGSFGMLVGVRPDYTPGLSPLPKFKKPVTVSWGTMYAINSSTQDIDAAWRLMRFFSSEDYHRILLKGGNLPGISSLLHPSVLDEYQQPNMPPGYLMNAVQYIIDAGFSPQYMPGSGEGLATFTQRAQEIWSGTKSVTQVVLESMPVLERALTEARMQ